MSNDIRVYDTIDDDGGQQMSLTALVGGVNGSNIQFSIGNKWCCLSEAALLDLIETIKKRLSRESGYSATDWPRDDLVFKEPEHEG
jgi:hypothetical protein